MRSAISWTALGTLLLGGCSHSATPDTGGFPIGSGGTAGMLNVGGSAGSAGWMVGSAGMAGATAGRGGAGGMTGGAGNAGGAGGAGGMPMTAGSGATGGASGAGGAAGAAGMAGAPGGTPGVPRIPEPMGDCPDFTSGTATIAGLRTQIDAGTPGATKGSLLFAWHATAGTAGAAMAGVPASVRSEITAGGGLVIAAQGNVGGMGRTDIAPPTGAWFIEDLEFADHVVACAVMNHNIDPNRIHATGCSAGGLMSGTFGLMRSEYVASVAPNSGGINYMASRMLSDTSHGPAAFSMHGGTGDNVIVNFGDTSMWFEAQNRMAANLAFMINCDHGRGHCGAPTALHEMAWGFMKAHPYDVGPSPWTASPPADLPDYCMVVP